MKQQMSQNALKDSPGKDGPGADSPVETGSREIGSKLRTLRLERKLSISDLAMKAGVSAGIISQIERGKSNPSMKTLQRIRTALGVSLWAFLDHSPSETSQDPGFVRRASDRLRIVVGQSQLIKELLSPHNDESLRFMIITMPPNSQTEEVLIGEGEKGGFILDGEVELTVAGRAATLAKGDSFQFRSHQSHQMANNTASSAQVLWIMSLVGPHL
ncbi:MAG TPA: helix-turn-helix domain-containing protein [Stellaceae bacterium]|nr:helix-turn-helix domain-containing protein [Stellaceae bacterium]